MSNHATLYVTSAEKDGEGEPILDPERVQVEFTEDDATRTCKRCGQDIHGNGDVWKHDDTGSQFCQAHLVDDFDPDEDEDVPTAEPESRGAADICNSASLNFEDDSVTVSISVGDPRGAFAMTVRRTGDGRLILHVPYEGEPMPHMPLKKLHEGTYEIVGGS